MKINKYFLITFFSILLISCSNGKSVETETESYDTIKSIIKNKEQKKNWTRELEGNLLTEPLKDDYIQRNYSISDEAFKSVYYSNQPVFPEIKDFGSLDLSSLNKTSIDYLKNFCNVLKSEYNPSKVGEYFNSKYIFNAVFFEKDLEENWKTNFGEKFPEYTEDKSSKLFESYYIGKPEFSQNGSFAEVPVMFFSKNRKLYVRILINPDEKQMIYQVFIDRWVSVNDQ